MCCTALQKDTESDFPFFQVAIPVLEISSGISTVAANKKQENRQSEGDFLVISGVISEKSS